MKFVVIFAEGNPLLISPKKVGVNSVDALNKLFKDWDNMPFLVEYFSENIPEIDSIDDSLAIIEKAATRTIQEAFDLKSKLLRCATRANENEPGETLDSMFVKLHTDDEDDVELRESKAYGLEDDTWLRIYAIRLEANCYIVTGGMIKLTRAIQDTDIGKKVYKNIKLIKAFLIRNNITNKQTLINYINANP